MKFCKVIVCFLLALCFAAGNGRIASAEKDKQLSEARASAIQKAKAYEDGKNWIWALNEYYNAIVFSQDSNEFIAAHSAYAELAEIINDGLPGKGTFDTFSLYEEWKKLLLETEEYGNSLLPYELYLGAFKAEKINLEDKTVDYVVPINFRLSTRYFMTVDVVAKGYAKVDKTAWAELPKVFPQEPVSENSLYTEGDYEKKCSFAFFKGNLNFPKGRVIIPYEGVFTIVDDDGTSLAESEPYIIGSRTAEPKSDALINFAYHEALLPFKNVPESVLKKIEAGKVRVELKSLNLLTGNVDIEWDGWAAKRSMSGGERHECGFYPWQIYDKDSNVWDKRWFLLAAFRNQYEKRLENGRTARCVLISAKEICKVLFGINYADLDGSNLVIVCNELSKAFGRKPVYMRDGASDICDIVIGEGKGLVTDKNANGFRAPADIDDLKKTLSIFKDLPPLEMKSGLFSDSYNYYTGGSKAYDNANLVLCWFD